MGGDDQPRRAGKRKVTPTKTHPSVKTDIVVPNPHILGRNCPKYPRKSQFTALLRDDKPRPGSLAEIVRLAEYAETFCRTYESEVVSHTRLYGPKTVQSAYSQSGAAAGIGGFVSPLLPTINPSK